MTGASTVARTPGLRLDPTAVLLPIRRHRWLIAITIAIALAIGLLVTSLATPRYRATATLQIEQQSERVLNTASTEAPTASANEERFLQTQTDILRSRSIATRVAQAQNLFAKPAVIAALGGAPATGSGTVSREGVVDLLLAGLSVDLPRNSRIVSVSMETTDPQLSASLANSYAEAFIQSNLQRGLDSSSYARDYLSKQLVETKAKLEDSERQLNDYARQAGLLSAPTAAGSAGGGGPAIASVTFDSLTQVNRAANDAQTTRIAAEQRWRAAERTPALALAEVQSNGAIQSLLGQRATLAASLSEERIQHRDDHPSVREKLARLDELDSQIQRLAGDVKTSLRNQYEAARAQEQSLSSEVTSLRASTTGEQDLSVRYNILAREVETNRQLYDGQLQRFKELSAAAGVMSNNIALIDRANPPAIPSSPSLRLNLALALLFGLIAAAGLVTWREQRDDAVRAPADVERKLELPALAAIPAAPDGQNTLALLAEPRSDTAEAYASLRGALLYATREGLPRSLLVTSAHPKEGKSMTAWAVASSLARLERRVLLIDGDLRKPTVHRLAQLANTAGTSDLLVGAKSLDEVIRQATAPGGHTLDVVTSGPIPPNPTDLLGSGRLEAILAELETRYQVVVIDGPPVLGLADAPTLSAHAEATLFVVEADRSGRGSTKTALKRLRAAQAHLIGVVLTNFDATKSGVGRDYGTAYYRYGAEADGGR